MTGLANFEFFEKKVQHLIKKNQSFDLIYINIDHFKEINESLGVYSANDILKLIGKRMTQVLTDTHSLISRIHGDEFAVVVFPDQNTNQIIDSLFYTFKYPIKYSHHSYYMTLSIGVTRFPEFASNYQELMQSAFYAVTEAKLTGKNTFIYFKPDMKIDINRKLLLKNCLHQSIEEKDFVMHYQPQFNQAGQIESYEALVRWQSKELGPVSPADFIPLAEETGLIIPLGYVLLEKILEDFPKLQQTVATKIKIAFNLSLKQFFDPAFLIRLQDLCNVHNVDVQNIKIEITESISTKSPKEVLKLMNAFRDLGMEIELDDFGTGYSSMQHLKSFPITCLKIDQSFVRDILQCPKTKSVVNSILYLAKELGLTVIAEGIETKEQLEYLKIKGCNGFQGYYLGKPEPVEYYIKVMANDLILNESK